MSNLTPIPEPKYGLLEQLIATIVIVGYHVLRSIASLGRR